MTGTGTQNDPFVIADWSDFITAVGTSDAYVEFPKNLVSTTDTDVNPNKLYVDSNGVVQKNVQPSDLANLYENTFEFDLNTIHPEAFTSTIQIKCASLKGNGATIKNISFDDCNGFTLGANTVINGLNVKNFYFATSSGKTFINAGASNSYISHLDYCMFSGRVDERTSSQYGNFISTYYGQAHSCSFNLQLANYARFRSTSNRTSFDMYNCRLNLTGETSKTLDILATNCYISGDISASIVASGQYSVFDVECNAISGSGTLILANSDKCSSISGLTSVTSAQLKDAAYLSSIGFPIQT